MTRPLQSSQPAPLVITAAQLASASIVSNRLFPGYCAQVNDRSNLTLILRSASTCRLSRTEGGTDMSPRMSRRGFLAASAGALGAIAAEPRLAACGSASPAAKTGAASGTTLKKILPNYVPSDLVKPDYPSVNGSSPAFLNYPAKLVRTVSETPGAGGSYTAITPLWG